MYIEVENAEKLFYRTARNLLHSRTFRFLLKKENLFVCLALQAAVKVHC